MTGYDPDLLSELLDIAERAVAESMRIDALNRAGVSVAKVAAAEAQRRLRYWRGDTDAPQWTAQ